MITPIERDEALYNGRDCCAMCRVYPHLVDAVARTDTADVYAVDQQMADLALQMTRVGMPVNSARRQEIGDRLRKLRDESLDILRPFTEGPNRELFLGWVSKFFAVKARKGEPADGSVRVGPTRAQVDVDELAAGRKDWQVYRKESLAAGDAVAVAEAEKVLADLDERWKIAKIVLRSAKFEDDANDGMIHTSESAFAQRMKIRQADAELAIGKHGVNFGAKVQQCAILRAAGVPLIKTTAKTGLPQVDKEILEGFRHHAAARALLKYILTDKTISVYIEGEKRAGKGGGKSRPVMVTDDGYVRPLWKVHQITGRWASQPNVQNWSKRAGGGEENLRDMIEAPPGWRLVGADEAQLEARVNAAMSQCQYLLDVFRRGEDVHGALAGAGFPEVWPKLQATFAEHKKAIPKGQKCPCPECAERDRVRDLAKRMEYGGYFYGGLPETIFSAIVGDFPDLTLRQVKFFIDSANKKMPEFLVWRAETLKQAIKEGEIRSPILGRRQVFPLGRVDPTVAYNYKAQSGAADLWALGAMAFMAKWDQFNSVDARIIHNGHDSVLILCPEHLAEQVAADVATCWDREWNGVRFFMETKIGKRWSET